MSESRRFATAKLLISVKPRDSSPPKISSTAAEGFVDENSAIGTKVIDSEGNPIMLTVSDADLVRIGFSVHFKVLPSSFFVFLQSFIHLE